MARRDDKYVWSDMTPACVQSCHIVSWRGVYFLSYVVWDGVVWCGVVWCRFVSYRVMSCVVSCLVMSCHVVIFRTAHAMTCRYYIPCRCYPHVTPFIPLFLRRSPSPMPPPPPSSTPSSTHTTSQQASNQKSPMHCSHRHHVYMVRCDRVRIRG